LALINSFDGFSRHNSGAENALALQRAVDDGGTVLVGTPGIYDIGATIKIGSDTTLFFGAGVYLRRAAQTVGGYLFINKGAYSRSWDRNIRISGLRLICNGLEARGQTETITGLIGQVSFYYIKNLIIEDFECLDLTPLSFAVQVCTFENLVIERVRVEGKKDAIHLGKGSKFVIRHGIFNTFDDPIALNAHDYSTSNPQLGWITDGLVEDCYDLNADATTGYFCRILSGAWVDWFEGMEVQHSDTVVHNKRLYRVAMPSPPDGQLYCSKTPPIHAGGTVVYDGIHWVMVQDDDIIYNCGCRNIHFRDIFLQKKRRVAFSVHFDHDKYSRSYYPNAPIPVQEDLIFENIFFENEIPCLIAALTPINSIKLINSVLTNSEIHLESLTIDGLRYPPTHVLMSGTTFKGAGKQRILHCDPLRPATLKILGSTTEESTFQAAVSGDVQVLATDIAVEG
jgi:hypothetical protein